jgi:endonuclease/exonuclease/phosphatase (EEP) superfamily protein YafD
MLDRLLIVWIAGGLLPLGARFWWGFELFSHFRLQFLALSLPLLALALTRRRFVTSLAIVLTMGVNAWGVLPGLPNANAAPVGPEFVLLNINVEAGNREHGLVLERIRESGADAVTLIELSPALDAKLDSLADLYPFRLTLPAANNFGLAVLSRYPLHAVEHFSLGPNPAIEAVVETPDGPLVLLAVHMMPPIGAVLAATRNVQLEALALRIRASEGPLLACGDLNLSPYSPWFADFEKASATRSVRRGQGPGISWPSFLPPLGVPIDHCFLRGPLAVAGVERMAATGSDHYPVRVTLRWQSAQ